MKKNDNGSTRDNSHIVSSSHLVTEKNAGISEFEFGLIIANNAFTRWMIHCAAAAGAKELNSIDILVMHFVNHRERAKRLTDICFTLNIEDTHTVNYALRKLTKQSLVEGERRGKEIFYSTTPKGKEICLKYREIRERCLIEALSTTYLNNSDLGETAKLLRLISGIYDQAARSANSL